jgi:hypothetical protein
MLRYKIYPPVADLTPLFPLFCVRIRAKFNRLVKGDLPDGGK